MRKNGLLFFLIVLFIPLCYGQIGKTKVVDNGGSGVYKSFAITEKSLPNFVVYRPENMLEALNKEGKLPIIVWANGGCMDSSIHHERLLSDIASHGYIIIAIGDLQMTVEERIHKPTVNEKLLEALNWISQQANNKESAYYNIADLSKIAAGGQSCGGAQILRIAGDKRIKTYMMFNSGMGDMTMAGASSNSLSKVDGSIIYIIGGESDVAYKNALLDYDRITHVPVVFANLLEGGHGGTFNQQFGGAFARLALNWLDWQFKNKDQSSLFLKHQLSDFPGWSMKSKNFN